MIPVAFPQRLAHALLQFSGKSGSFAIGKDGRLSFPADDEYETYLNM